MWKIDDEAMKIKSRNRPYFKLSVFAIVSLFCGLSWLNSANMIALLVCFSLIFVIFVEFFAYTQTFLEVNENSLKVRRKGALNLVNEDFEIQLKDIQSTFYQQKVYDKWELYQRFFWELFFPSGQSVLIIHLNCGETQQIPFDGNVHELVAFANKLPDRAPN